MISNTNQALLFLVDTVLSLYILVVLLRVVLQLVHADFRNPVSQFVWQTTRTPVNLLRNVVPRWRNLDVPALLFAFILCYLLIQIDLALGAPGFGPQFIPAVAWAILKGATLVCNLYFFTIIVQAVMSWISPNQYTPATAILFTINEPLLRPIRRIVPTISGIDLSPLVAIIGLQLISRLLPLPGLFR
ncbi:YggT family protein [Salinisphaera sp. Q1T1-3]|uniref:YggT family protein n=1 Tax=Salinisphaera sp. Q1T1-3 TaxID=2321229 RepID=UPI000E72F27A|nr:YggT family protein [Salinisphaera sp. Q1T1-3]RJS94669.1 YggT family protein [Salinisphaera sp. Q1T1-3]